MRKKLFGAIAALGLTLLCIGSAFSLSHADSSNFRDLNQAEIFEEMGVGWNLGNQLEASSNGVPSETVWGNPKITETIIKSVKAAGFSTIRIPVSYLKKIDDNNGYKIDEAWLNRVQEVVDMCMKYDLYATINIHGDGYYSVPGSWLLCDEAQDKQTKIKEKYAAVWKQIATKFKDYDEHLIFESMNEEHDGNYGAPKKSAYENINAYNQIFVDTVRQTGGNNAKRWLLLPGWNTNIEYTAGNYGFKLPTDTNLSAEVPSGEKRIMISVHYYDPYCFCLDESNDNVTQWGDAVKDSSKADTWGDETYLNTEFTKLYTTFVCKGYPVVIGEYGAIDRSQADSQNKAARAEYVKKVCLHAKENGLVPVYWDNGYDGNHGHSIINRSTGKVLYQDIVDGILAGYQAGTLKKLPINASTPTPVVTKTPTPEVTKSPDATKTPVPAVTKSPDATKTPVPAVTKSPDATKTPVPVVKVGSTKIQTTKNLKTRKVKLTWKKAANAKKYQIAYSTSGNMKNAKTVSVSATGYTLTKLKKGKTYYIRVRGINGKVSGKWTTIKKIKIKK